MYAGKYEDVMPLDGKMLQGLTDRCKELVNSGNHPYTNLEIGLFRTIEAQQQEIEQLHESGKLVNKKHIEYTEVCAYLQNENNQLRAQVTRMREAMRAYNDWLEPSCDDEILKDCTYYQWFKRLLSDTPTEYHNPADIEALRLAGKAIKVHLKINDCDCLREALATIEQIGGKEDVR